MQQRDLRRGAAKTFHTMRAGRQHRASAAPRGAESHDIGRQVLSFKTLVARYHMRFHVRLNRRRGLPERLPRIRIGRLEILWLCSWRILMVRFCASSRTTTRASGTIR